MGALCTAKDICIPYNTGTFTRADNEPVEGDANVGLTGASPEDTPVNADEEIFGGETPANADDEMFGV